MAKELIDNILVDNLYINQSRKFLRRHWQLRVFIGDSILCR